MITMKKKVKQEIFPWKIGDEVWAEEVYGYVSGINLENPDKPIIQITATILSIANINPNILCSIQKSGWVKRKYFFNLIIKTVFSTEFHQGTLSNSNTRGIVYFRPNGIKHTNYA